MKRPANGISLRKMFLVYVEPYFRLNYQFIAKGFKEIPYEPERIKKNLEQVRELCIY